MFVTLRYGLGLLLAALLLALTACGAAGPNAADDDVADDSPMVFRVGSTTVTENDFEQRLEESLGPPILQLLTQGQTPEQITELATQQNVRESVLNDMIQEYLLVEVAREEGIGVDAEEIDAAVEQQQSMGALPGEEPESTPTPEEEAELREEIARQQLVQAVIARHTRADMFNSKHILVEEEATAEEVMDKLEEGEDFAELASEYSIDPGSADSGGEYGWVPRGTFVPEYEEAAFDAELNEPVLVESQFGFHVIVVEDREENRAFEDFEQLSSAGNAQQYYEETFVPWYEDLRAQAEEDGTLEVNEDFDPTSVPLPFPDETEMPPQMGDPAPQPPDAAPDAEEPVPADPEDGATEDGATEDDTTEDGATEDGATEDGATDDDTTEDTPESDDTP
jgi:peptidyl-prolyl cis-trans isomerase C